VRVHIELVLAYFYARSCFYQIPRACELLNVVVSNAPSVLLDCV
jgi:hypothetical protein